MKRSAEPAAAIDVNALLVPLPCGGSALSSVASSTPRRPGQPDRLLGY